MLSFGGFVIFYLPSTPGLKFSKEIFPHFNKNPRNINFANLIRKSFCHDYKCADITEFACSLELSFTD